MGCVPNYLPIGKLLGILAFLLLIRIRHPQKPQEIY